MSDSLDALTREELHRLAKKQGLSLPASARKADLTAALQKSTRSARRRGASNAQATEHDASEALAYDLRPDAPAPAPHGLPWGYGETRVKAIPRDPRWLYVYWEATDEAIAAARAQLGPSGDGARFALRVYDTTFRLFDGTNANSSFDVAVDRVWNSYFLEINRPRSVVQVDIGLASHDGQFATLARSGAAEMPSDGASSDTHAEWMTVIPQQRPPLPQPYRHRYTPRFHPAPLPPPPGPSGSADHGGDFGGAGDFAGGGFSGSTGTGRWSSRGQHVTFSTSWSSSWSSTTAWQNEVQRVLSYLVGGECVYGEWFEQVLKGQFIRWVRWEGPRQQTSWSTGPVRIPWQSVGPVEIWFQGRRHVKFDGPTSVVGGPWHVVITGIGAKGERRVLDTWFVRMASITGGMLERTQSRELYRRVLGAYGHRSIFAGASEKVQREEMGSSQELFAGASERLWLGASEMQLGGASETVTVGSSEMMGGGGSEMAWLGSSEIHWGGASLFAAAGSSEIRAAGSSETMVGGASLFTGSSGLALGGASKGAFGGASELVFQGGSEVHFQGASEMQFQGASEVQFQGASEVQFQGASEAQFQGASEMQFQGASEAVLGLSSGEQWHAYSAAPTAAAARTGSAAHAAGKKSTRATAGRASKVITLGPGAKASRARSASGNASAKHSKAPASPKAAAKASPGGGRPKAKQQPAKKAGNKPRPRRG